jgi:hypothetical protein
MFQSSMALLNTPRRFNQEIYPKWGNTTKPRVAGYSRRTLGTGLSGEHTLKGLHKTRCRTHSGFEIPFGRDPGCATCTWRPFSRKVKEVFFEFAVLLFPHRSRVLVATIDKACRSGSVGLVVLFRGSLALLEIKPLTAPCWRNFNLFPGMSWPVSQASKWLHRRF